MRGMKASDKRRDAGSRIVGNGRRQARRVVLRAAVVLPTGLLLGATTGRAQAAATPQNTVLVVGDSLSAEYGLKRGSGWVAMMQARLTSENLGFAGHAGPATVVNASISGETTAGGWARYPALIDKHRPAAVIIALGSNDALRGLDLTSTSNNLARMLDTARATGARAVLVGMMLPPNYGKAYADRFAAMYADLAKAHGASLVPFLMDGFADDLGKFQADRIHPNESAQAQMLANVWPAVLALAKPATRTPKAGS